VVRFLNWDDYIGATTFSDFKSGTGVDVVFTPFRNNQEMFDAVSRPDHGYDVIVPTNEFVGRLMASDLLMPLDEPALPNKRNIQRQFSDALFDPGRRYSIPYVWGTLGTPPAIGDGGAAGKLALAVPANCLTGGRPTTSRRMCSRAPLPGLPVNDGPCPYRRGSSVC
jgi:hypothetical protein